MTYVRQLCHKSHKKSQIRLNINRRYSTNETDRRDITEIVLKVALNTLNQTKHVELTLKKRSKQLDAP